MKVGQFYSQRESVIKTALQSMSGHFLVVVFFLAIGKLTIFNHLVKPKDENLLIVKSAVRVDVVGMPKFTIQELKQMAPELDKEVGASASGEAKETEEENTSNSEGLNSFLSKYSSKKVKIPKNKGDGAGKSGLNKNDLSKLRNLVMEGNKLSKGTSLIGDINENELTTFQSYLSQLPDHVRKYWKLPSFLMNRDELKCGIRIFVGSRGELIKHELYSSSGNEEYDRLALRAVQMASPYPPPPNAITYSLSTGRVVLSFPL